MSHIQTEFGGSNPISLSEYYGVNANVPASGQISMSQFLGISALTVNAQAIDASSYDYSGSGNFYEAVARVTFHSNGVAVLYSGTITSAETPQGSWTWLVTGTAGQVDLKITGYSGNPLSTGLNLNERYVLSTTRSLAIVASSSGDPADLVIASNTISYSLVSNSSGSTLGSNSGTLYAEAGSFI
jgi:hypothetical protein